MTVTPGFTRTRDGESVRSVSAGFCPMPKTFTDVARVLYLGLFPKGCVPQALRQLGMDSSTPLASDDALIKIAAPIVTQVSSCLVFIIASSDSNV
jgi:hypothetical protein